MAALIQFDDRSIEPTISSFVHVDYLWQPQSMAASVLCCKTQDNTIGKDRPLKTATYLRVSTNDQDLEAQRQLLDRFGGDCRDPQLNLVAKYFDFGKSGDSFNSRPGLQ